MSDIFLKFEKLFKFKYKRFQEGLNEPLLLFSIIDFSHNLILKVQWQVLNKWKVHLKYAKETNFHKQWWFKVHRNKKNTKTTLIWPLINVQTKNEPLT